MEGFCAIPAARWHGLNVLEESCFCAVRLALFVSRISKSNELKIARSLL
jgi:hypothetical protein